MKKIPDNIDHVIQNLRDRKPEITEPSLLTEQIMKEIRARSEMKPSKIIYWLRYTSTVASALLLFLFIFEQTGKDNVDQSEALPLKYISEFNISECVGENSSVSDYKELYSCYLNKKYIQKDIRKKILNLSDYESNP